MECFPKAIGFKFIVFTYKEQSHNKTKDPRDLLIAGILVVTWEIWEDRYFDQRQQTIFLE